MQQKTSYPADANYEVIFEWYARVESNHRTRLRRPLLYPLSYGRVYRTNVIIAQGCRRCNPYFLFSVQGLKELFRPCFFRMVEYFFRSPGFHHSSIAHEHHFVRDFPYEIHLMADDDHGTPFGSQRVGGSHTSLPFQDGVTRTVDVRTYPPSIRTVPLPFSPGLGCSFSSQPSQGRTNPCVPLKGGKGPLAGRGFVHLTNDKKHAFLHHLDCRL